MSKQDQTTDTTNETLNKLIDLIATRDEAAEQRAVKTDDKIDKLVDSVTTLNISHVESQKDNKEIFKTLERHEINEEKQDEKLASHSEAIAVHDVKIASSKSVIREGVGVVLAILVAVSISKLT